MTDKNGNNEKPKKFVDYEDELEKSQNRVSFLESLLNLLRESPSDETKDKDDFDLEDEDDND